MTDEEFLARFEACALEDFRHRDHVRVAWLYLQKFPYERAVREMELGIRRYAAHHGAPDKYHHTVTLVWMRVVAAACREHAEDFAGFLARCPHLLDPDTPRRYYSPARLDSPEARSGWLDPDLSDLPELANEE